MPKSVHTARHKALAQLIADQRKSAGLTQAAVAAALGRHQPFVAKIEQGDRRVDLVELLEIADLIGLDVHQAIETLRRI